MSTDFVVATLSVPATDEEKLKEAFQNKIQWEYSKYSNPIHAVYLLQPNIAIIYAQKELIDELLSRKSDNILQVDGSMSVTFSNGHLFPSNCIAISFIELPTEQQITILNTIHDTFQLNFATFPKNNKFTLRFGAIEEAANGYQIINKYATEKCITIHAQIINISEHIALRCVWKGANTLSATITKLKSTGQNFVSSIQSCLRFVYEFTLNVIYYSYLYFSLLFHI